MVYEDIDSLKDEILVLHRKLAAVQLEADSYKQRYEASNTKYLAKERELMNFKYPEPPEPPETRTFDNYHERITK